MEFFSKNCLQIFFRNKTVTLMFRRVLNVSLYSQYKCIEAVVQACSKRKGVLKICSKFTGEHPC